MMCETVVVAGLVSNPKRSALQGPLGTLKYVTAALPLMQSAIHTHCQHESNKQSFSLDKPDFY